MKKLSEEINELKNLLDKMYLILNTTEVREKDIIDCTFSLFKSCYKILGNYNNEKLDLLKNKDLSTFLRFVPKFKELLEETFNYVNSIENSINTIYTTDITAEIVIFKEKIYETSKKLKSLSKNLEPVQKIEELENEYKSLQILLKEKERLNKARIELSKVDTDQLLAEIEKLSLEVKTAEEKLQPLNNEKIMLEEQLKNYKSLETEIEFLKNSKGNFMTELISRINEAITFIQGSHADWNSSTDVYFSKLENETEKLKNTENEIKKYLTDISMYKNKYIKNKDIIEKHFVSNKNIAESMPNLNESISDHLGKISDEISVLDTKIKSFLEVNQQITDEVTKNPFVLDD